MLIPEEVLTFLAIRRSGSLAEAAKLVHASQSTVSYRLQMLESRLGERLVERARGAHETNLTLVGERFAVIAERWESLLQETERIRGSRGRSLAIGAASAINAYLLPELYTKLGAWQPPLDLTIETDLGPRLCEQVALGHLDVGFVFYERKHADLIVTPFASSPMVLVRSSGSSPLGDEDAPVDVQQLPANREVYMKWGPDFDLWRQEFLSTAASLRFNRADVLAPLLAVPEIWAMMPEFVAKALVARTGAHMHQVTSPPPDKVVYEVRNRHARASVRAALSILTACVDEIADDIGAHMIGR